MFFTIIERSKSPPTDKKNAAYLIEDRWDDWGKYKTQFSLVVFDSEGNRYDPGDVKIGERGLLPSSEISPGKRAPNLDSTFDALDETYISLGQNQNYYETLNTIPSSLRLQILQGLRDCAYDPGILDLFENEEVLRESLLRSVSPSTIQNKLQPLSHGNAVLTQFYFKYKLPPNDAGGPPPNLDFYVVPKSEPPTNVHVIIGRNGVGKTRCLESLAGAFAAGREGDGRLGSLEFNSALGTLISETFAGLVIVSFSAFDDFTIPKGRSSGMKIDFVGLRTDGDSEISPDAPVEGRSFSRAFCQSLSRCRTGLRRERLLAALLTLANDPLFSEAGIIDLLQASDTQWEAAAQALFSDLSSGHAIVLLTITRLVELVDERTFVLIDEPEGHLHPPLLSAFIRALSDLLVKRNGVALISTHSPVVLQEVPRSCVWKLNRFGNVATAERPRIETFGENVGVLTREVFQLEVTTSGFHNFLKKAVDNPANNYEAIVAHFDGQLGAEARGILRALLAIRDNSRAESAE